MTTKNSRQIKHFTDLTVWQKAHTLFIHVYGKSNEFPRTRGGQIVLDQILRSSGSISANIAEGFNARSTKVYVHFSDIAQRSAAETENWTFKITGCEILPKNEVASWLDLCSEIERMLQSLIKSLERKRKTSALH